MTSPADSLPSTAVEAHVTIEVRYAETDQMGVVHHAVYPVWFELARTRLCNQSGYHYADIEKLGFYLMVTAMALDFRQSARYGDAVDVACRLVRFASRALRFEYEVASGGRHLAAGTTDHVWIDRKSQRPCRIPSVLEGPFRRLAGLGAPL